MRHYFYQKFLLGSLLIFFLVTCNFIAMAVNPVSASRSISPSTVGAGGTFTVTVTIHVNVAISQGLVVDEDPPSGWTVTQVNDGGGTYRAATTEWFWLSGNAGDTKTVIYKMTVPAGTPNGTYPISGKVEVNNPSFDGNVIGDSSVTVRKTGKILQSIAAAPTSVSLNNVGATKQLTITATYSNNTTANVTSSATYTSSNTPVATVSSSGLITATGVGSATITVSYTEGAVTKQTTVPVTVSTISSVTADFSWTPSEPVIGESVNFHDQSYTPNGIISSWFWDFGDGSASTSQNPQHTYSSVGGYRVCLTVTDNTETSDTACKDILVSPNAPTEVDFSWEPSNPTVGEEVNFHDQSQAPTGYYISSWSWDFGDGSTSTSQNPQHTYSIAGSYSVCLTVTDNTGTSSIGCKDISVGGGTCTYSISPTSKAFDTSGGSGSFKVMTGSGCQWTAQSDSDWITITSGKSGTGNGTVYYTVTADSGSARTGHITVEGQQYTINQGVASCTYTISPTSQSFGASGGTGSFNVMTSRPDCMWIGTVESDADWITITGMTTATLSGGDGTVQYAVAPTPNSGNERTGHIAVEGHTFTVMQGPSPNTPISSTHTYGSARGWYMVSVPLNSGAASDLFGTTAYRWNPATGQYDLPTTIELTKGYWVNLSASKAVTDTGYEIATDVIIDISSNGWHQISAPWPYPKDSIQVTKGSQTKSWADAVAADWVRDSIYGYKATDGNYTTPTAIDPWYGYWVKAKVSGLSLKLVYASRTSVSPPTPPTAFAPMDLPSLPGSTLTAPLPQNLEFTNIPNPITDVYTTRFTVAGPMAMFVEAIKVQIYDLSGRLVYEEEKTGTSTEWHTENQIGEILANGVYLWKMYALIDGKWVESETKKLVILR